jgi:hypothetical protein
VGGQEQREIGDIVKSLRKQELRISVVFVLAILLTVTAFGANRVRTQAGIVEGTRSADSIVYVFKGIPYAAPPVGPLRWKAPQPTPLGEKPAKPRSLARVVCKSISMTTCSSVTTVLARIACT